MTSPPKPSPLDIGTVIELSGVAASTLHVWERAGLITSIGRVGLRRQYDPDILARISLIVLAKRAGFTLAEINALFSPDAFAGGKNLLQTKLDELRDRRLELDAAIEGLEHAMACPSSSPFECEDFRKTLPTVLPVSS